MFWKIRRYFKVKVKLNSFVDKKQEISYFKQYKLVLRIILGLQVIKSFEFNIVLK